MALTAEDVRRIALLARLELPAAWLAALLFAAGSLAAAGAVGPLTSLAPTCNVAGAMIYVFSPSVYSSSASRAVRPGSYSIAFTVASTPCLLRLKSTSRIFCL